LAPICDDRIDAAGGTVTPGFVDSHTHAVFAGDRSRDFAARMAGEKYSPGGINTTVLATRAASFAELTEHTAKLVKSARANGTTTIEIKSGYGLQTDAEVKLLQVAAQFTSETTYLGAHLVPTDSNRDEYVELAAGPMLQACAPYAKWIDVFCDQGAFTVDEARHILQSGIEAGLQGRIHGNQIGNTGGALLAAELGLASVDHCTFIDDETLSALSATGVTATLLPATEFFTKAPYPDANRLLAAGVNLALASNCNPGSSYLISMPIVMTLAVREMKMSAAQALYAATAGGAKALRRSDIGHLTIGAKADFVIWQAPNYEHLVYRMGEIDSQTFTA
jgi:imidazolonepropionase